jgi:hypothetical protein
MYGFKTKIRIWLVIDAATLKNHMVSVSWKINLLLILDKEKTNSLHWIITLIVTDNNTHFFMEKIWIGVDKGVAKFSYSS